MTCSDCWGIPSAAITKPIAQFQRGVSDFLSAVDNFNKTMEQMKSVANRIDAMLDNLEEPVKALVPQLTRTIKSADAMVQQLSGPVDRVTPGLSKLADVLDAPSLGTLPGDLTKFMTTLSGACPTTATAGSDGRVRRQSLRHPFAVGVAADGYATGRQPIGAIAGRRGRGEGGSAAGACSATKAVRKRSPAKKAPAKKSAAKKTTAKKAAAKKAPAEETTAKKAVAKKR